MNQNVKPERVRNVPAFIRGALKNKHGEKLMNRPEGHVPTGKTHKAAFYAVKGDRVVVTTKEVRETAWRSTAMAQAMAKAVLSV